MAVRLPRVSAFSKQLIGVVAGFYAALLAACAAASAITSDWAVLLAALVGLGAAGVSVVAVHGLIRLAFKIFKEIG
ncbi:hypothetical protein [Actinocatenispora rupis]|uniref:Uncharacterized protein n=1 Tax=Actinocatenispora rupis TaxID=519421 RepID=A0A8J3J9G3_9ACTN|nr:hypothetical protein [Actinocatenispora rupis]GID14146.1 hypothetical protein Aru02nite_50350 [Actinocatenispora rupis]